MDTLVSLLVFATLPLLVTAEVPTVIPFRAVVEVVQGSSRIFSGESLRLRCSVPDDHRSSWDYLWFRGDQRLPQSGEEVSLWNSKVKESGKFSCQGVRDSLLGDLHTLKSLPVEITVDGGFAILDAPPHPGLVEGNLTITCRVRGNRPVREKILYKDDVEVMRQDGLEPHFHLNNVTLEDTGMYSCRASWDRSGQTVSVISTAIFVQIMEVLSQPVLEIETNMPQKDQMMLTCHVQYNSPPPAPPIHFYFYRNNIRLGTATSENNDVVRQTPGLYSCKARVPVLGYSKWSEPVTFGEVKEPQTVVPPHPDPNHQQQLSTTAASTETSAPPAAQPVTAELFSTASTYLQYTEEAGDTSQGSWNFSGESGNISKEPEDISKVSGDNSEESGDFCEESGDFSEESGDFSGESGDFSEESGDFSGESRDFSEASFP